MRALYLAYAYEALARVEQVTGNTPLVERYLVEAGRLAGAVTDVEDKQLLLNDLKTVQEVVPNGHA
jgi:hypothetical protein